MTQMERGLDEVMVDVWGCGGLGCHLPVKIKFSEEDD